MIYENDLIEEFVIEAKEHLSSIEEDFLKMEKTQDKEIVAKIFRAVHSIKGAAGFLGFSKISDLTHIMETMMQMIRSGDAKPTEIIITAMLSGIDRLNFLINNIKKSETYDVVDIVDKISSLLAKAMSPRAKKEMASKKEIRDKTDTFSGFQITEYLLNTRPANHTCLYILKYDLSEFQRTDGLSPVALVNELLSTGEILDARLNTPAEDLNENLEKSPLYYEVLYSTVLETDLIMDAARLPLENITQLSIGDIMKSNPAKKEAKETSIEKTHENVKEVKETAIENKNIIETEKGNNHQEHLDTIRINVNVLDRLMTLAGELVLVRNQHLMRSLDKSDSTSRGISQRLDIVTTELQETIMRTRMQPVGNIFGKLPRIVRDISQKLNKKMEIAIIGEEVELDKTILESLADPLIHIIRNCCDHGIETTEKRESIGKNPTGTINLKAFHEGGQINIEIKDDGKGIDPEAIKEKVLKLALKTREELSQMTEKEIIFLITLPGFSTAEKISAISGRGVGMDVVKTAIEKMGGTLDINSKVNKGTTIHLRLPLTLAIIPCLIVVVDKCRYAIPQVNLEELVCLYDGDIKTKIESENNQEVYRLRNNLLPLVRLSEVINIPKPFTEHTRNEITEKYRKMYSDNAKISDDGTINNSSLVFVVVRVGATRFGLIIDKVIGTEEIVVKPMHSALKSLKIYSGATVMGDGLCAMILDIDGIAIHAGLNITEDQENKIEESMRTLEKENIQTVLLFKYGINEQFAVTLPLIKRIEKISKDKIEVIGSKEYITLEGVSIRIVRMDQVFKVSPFAETEDMFLLMPKHSRRPFGILISSLIDIVQAPLELNIESFVQNGILGSAIVRDRMTLFPDIYRMFEILESEWFSGNKRITDNKKKKILLVEDAVFFRQLVKGYLESDGYEVTTAENGKRGLEKFKESEFNMIISDIEMPEMDGFDFIKNIRLNKDNKEIPAIALTALDSEKDKSRAVESGFNNYQVKIDREGLLKCVSQMI